MCSFLLIHPMLLKRYFLNTLLRPLLHWLCLADTGKCDIRILMIWLTKGIMIMLKKILLHQGIVSTFLSFLSSLPASSSPPQADLCCWFLCFQRLASSGLPLLSPWLPLLYSWVSFLSLWHSFWVYVVSPWVSWVSLISWGWLLCSCLPSLQILLLFSGSSFSLLSSAFLFPMATAVAGQVRLTKEYKGQPMYILCDLKNA